MNIEMQDALVIYSILYFFGFITFLSVARKYKPHLNKNYIFFAGFFLLNSIGVVGIFYRASLPIFVSVVVANFILYLGYVSLLVAVYLFYKIKVPHGRITVVSLLYLTLFIIFTYVLPDFKDRIIVYTVFTTILVLSILVRYIKEVKKYNIFDSIFGLSLVILLFVNLWRLTLLVLPTASINFLNYNADSGNIILLGVAGNMIAAGVLALINNQILDDAKQVDSIFINSIKNAPAPIMVHAEDGTVLNISKKWTEISKYEKSDIPTFYEWTRKAYGKKKDEVIDFIMKIYEFPEMQHDAEFVVTTKDGRQVTWDFHSGYIGMLPDGRKAAMSVATDITERLEKEKRISYLSYHDQLTGLYNRRFFEEQMVRLDNPRNLPISFIIGDVNGLKLVNDAFGHNSGDKLLKIISDIVSESIRGNDIAARWGGDEFAILLINSDTDAAETLIKRIEDATNKSGFEYGKASISFGHHTKSSMDESMDDVFVAAELLMYQNKLVEEDSIRGETINTIMATLFEKSASVEEHSIRVSELASRLATKMKLSKFRVNDIKTMGMIHDIGKIVTDLNVLEKPGKLTIEERNIIEKHPLSGSKMLSTSHEYKRLAVGVLHHHERIDGKGYPNGLKGDQIPIESRIIAVADAFDAMTAVRPYRKIPLTKEQAIKELQKHSGTQFDKEIVTIFVSMIIK